MSLRVHVEECDSEAALLAVLQQAPDDARTAFVRDGDGLIGWGVAARLPVGTGPNRFANARAALQETVGAAVGERDQVVAVGSFTFDEGEDASLLTIPRQTLVRRDGHSRIITVGADPDGADDLRSILRRSDAPAAPDLSRGGDGRPRHAGSTVRDDRWLEAVAEATRVIRTGEVEKVVLARDLHLWSRTAFDLDHILHGLATTFPSCFTFLVDQLVGASPELLLAREGTTLRSRVLAGTAARAADPAADDLLGEALLASTKDRREHDLALRSAVDALSPVCEHVEAPDGPSLLRLDNVQHLGSDLTGTVAPTVDLHGEGHILDLVGRLHPTAAVGGAPRDRALRAIDELEGMSRGRYAGPVGWCTAAGDGAFAIALRCAKVDGDRARLFAGAGIVEGSLPEAELTETWLKLRAMTGVLDR